MTRLLHIGRARDSAAAAGGTGDAPTAGGSGGGAESGVETEAEGGTATAAQAGVETGSETGAQDGAEAGAEEPAAGSGTKSVPEELPARTDAESDPEPDGSHGEQSGTRDGVRRPGGLIRRVAPAACAALLVIVGSGFFYGAHQLRATPSAENHALTDAEATTRVAGDVGNALARVFSYTPNGLETTERAARSVLAGRAERQYTELMGRIREDLAARHITLSTQAVRTGVIELDDDSARLLVFLDQISHRGKARATSAAAQLTVTARWEDDRWRIVDIRTR